MNKLYTLRCQHCRNTAVRHLPREGNASPSDLARHEQCCLLLSPVSCVPSSFPWPPSPGGASAIRTRSGRLSTAPRRLRDPSALSPGSGVSRRSQPSAAAPWSSLPAAPPRRAPAAGARPGGASAARPTRSRAGPLGGSPSHPPRGHPRASAGSGHHGRPSGPRAPRARESPPLSPVRGRCL